MRYLDKFISYTTLLFIFLLPWQARWIISVGQINGGGWEYGTQSVYVTEILLGVILVLFIIRGMSCWRPKADSIHSILKRWILSLRSRMTPHQTSLRSVGTGQATLVVVFLFLIYVGLSVFWAIDKNTALIHWRWLVEAAVLFLMLSSGFIKKEKIYWAIILSAVVQVAFAVAQSHMQYIPASTVLGMSGQSASDLGVSVVETMNGRWLRAYGSFPHPNILGAWLVLGLVTIVALIGKANSKQQTGDRKEKFLSAICYLLFAILLFGLLLTFSRSAWLAFLLLIAYSLWLAVRHSMRWSVFIKITAVSALTIITFAALFPDPFFSRFSSRLFGGQANRLETKSNIERVGSWREGVEIIKKHPLLGVGLGNYGLAVHRDIDSTKPVYYYQPVHNVPLLIWAELGIIGILFSVSYFPLAIFRYRISMFLAPLLILSLFDHYLFSLYSGLLIGAVYLANISRK